MFSNILRTKLLPAASILLLAAAPIRKPNAVSEISWGKDNVSFDQYRLDAVQCNVTGAYSDISKAEPTTRYLEAFRQRYRNINMQQPAYVNPAEEETRIAREFQPDHQIDEVAQLQLARTEQCLRDRGYRPFQLTRQQKKMLNSNLKGSPARHQYLYSLASDGAILSQQPVR